MVFFFLIPLLFAKLPNPINLQCDLKKIASIPKVYLVGEVHVSPESISFRNMLLKDGAKGTAVVISEINPIPGQGNFLPHERSKVSAYLGGTPETSKLFGLESEIPYAVSTSYFLQNSFLSNKQINFEGNLRKNTLWQKVLDEMCKKNSGDKYEPQRKQMIGRVCESLVKKTGEGFYYFTHQKDSRKLKNWFFNEFHRDLISFTNAQYSSHFGKKLKPRDNFFKNFLGINPLTLKFSHVRLPFLQARDRDFGNTIGNILCQFSGQVDKVIVILGDAHVSGVKKQLSYISGNKVETMTFRSHKDEFLNLNCQVRDVCGTGNVGDFEKVKINK